MSIPIWFLDVDGVVNAAGKDVPAHLASTEATTEGIDWPIRYSPEVVDLINRVHRSRLAEVRWLTTWSQDARTSLAPAVGLDEFFSYDMYGGEDWWKAEVVARSIAEEGRPVAWTDDDLEAARIDDLNKAAVPALAIAPITELGLETKDLRRISDFLSEISP